MFTFLIVQLALAAPNAIPPADQTAPPASQQQTPVGESTEQKGETPATTTQANTPSAEPKPGNGAPTGATTMTQPSRTRAGGSGAATPVAEHKTERHHVHRKRRPPEGVH